MLDVDTKDDLRKIILDLDLVEELYGADLETLLENWLDYLSDMLTK